MVFSDVFGDADRDVDDGDDDACANEYTNMCVFVWWCWRLAAPLLMLAIPAIRVMCVI